jgi:hypothetical protein
VPLAITKRQGITPEALAPGNRQSRGGVQSTAQEYNCSFLRHANSIPNSLLSPSLIVAAAAAIVDPFCGGRACPAPPRAIY